MRFLFANFDATDDTSLLVRGRSVLRPSLLDFKEQKLFPVDHIKNIWKGMNAHNRGEAVDLDMEGFVSSREVGWWSKDNLLYEEVKVEMGSPESPYWIHVSYKKRGIDK